MFAIVAGSESKSRPNRHQNRHSIESKSKFHIEIESEIDEKIKERDGDRNSIIRISIGNETRTGTNNTDEIVIEIRTRVGITGEEEIFGLKNKGIYLILADPPASLEGAGNVTLENGSSPNPLGRGVRYVTGRVGSG
ncbi:hypothetical protein EVAR_75634_1 [Eumeta japonica]|uniref:Uncharacterized protein n=1 Tax=Eumeta variegata TaxID=151549 RepID=A0A4C1U019_EUMVA|nr:hypothetical protein EVAR_75634_1 [Eumeta japonica]